ncbi:putative PEP-binding protein [Propionicicella superfundia]|uniref:putative PEP-binding protein n=1 Tax=Propionicicella superfundia TaxID=348582 RepID=UPI000427E714|nr:putative PEP-binding protein [Propionicicella superfundia]
MTQLTGTGVVAGVAYAPARWAAARPEIKASAFAPVPEANRAAELERFEAAVAAVEQGYLERAQRVAEPDTKKVLEATAGLVKDRGLMRMARKEIAAGTAAEGAMIDSIDSFIQTMQKLGGLMAERATDLRDIRDRVVGVLMDLPEFGIPESDTPIVLLTTDLSPADAAMLDPATVQALVLSEGGPTSHTSIVARQRGIPCVVAVPGLATISEDEVVLVDGGRGTVSTEADPSSVERLIAEDRTRRDAVRTWQGPGRTADGYQVALLANVQSVATAQEAAQTQAEGVGLFRTELAFSETATEPSVTDQAKLYAGVFAAFPEGKVVVRTLDAGSDKPVPFVLHEKEDNPSLGVRGIRLQSLKPEGMLDRQLDAIAQGRKDSGAEGRAWVMAPMIATVDEAREFAAKVRSRGMIPGIMVEVPAVCVLADEFIAEVEFMSVGTNDLTQYTMAADRLSPSLVSLNDPWQPAVLRMLSLAATACTKTRKTIGVCGEAASDPLLGCVLVGLGISYLSMADKAIPGVGSMLGSVTLAQCQAAAQAALAATDPQGARHAAESILRGDRD